MIALQFVPPAPFNHDALRAWVARHVHTGASGGLRGEPLRRGPARWHLHAVALDAQPVDVEIAPMGIYAVSAGAPEAAVLAWLRQAVASLGPSRCYLGDKELPCST